jgi:hypothetical protein
MKKILLLLITVYTLYGASAIKREIEFTQPDGTTFKGYLKGDSAFHWIESGDDVIIYNPKDRYYYKAIVDKENGLQLSNERAGENLSQKSLYIKGKKEQPLSVQKREALQYLYIKAKNAHNPK